MSRQGTAADSSAKENRVAQGTALKTGRPDQGAKTGTTSTGTTSTGLTDRKKAIKSEKKKTLKKSPPVN